MWKYYKQAEISSMLFHWSVNTQLQQRNVEQSFNVCFPCFSSRKRKVFLPHIVTDNEKWIQYDNPKHTKLWGKLSHAAMSSTKSNVHGSKLLLCMWDQLGVHYYELLKQNKTITGDCYQVQLMHLSQTLKEIQLLYKQRQNKVLLLHDKSLTPIAKPTWKCLNAKSSSLDIASSNYRLFWSTAHSLTEQHFHSYENAKKWFITWIASKYMSFFQHGIEMLPEKWEKVVAMDGKYFQ